MKETLQQENKLVEQMANGFASTMMEEEAPSGMKLLPSHARQEQLKSEFKKLFHDVKKSIEEGVHSLLATLIQLSKEDNSYFSVDVVNDLCKFVEFSLKLSEFQHIKAYFEGLGQEKSLQEMCGMSDETLKRFYKAAKYLYEHKEYEHAMAVFGILNLLNPKKPIFLLSIGHSAYFLHQYEAALNAYAICSMKHPLEYSCHLYSCKCYEEMNQIDLAINALDLALIVIADNPELNALKQEIASEQKRLTQKLET